MPEVKHRLRLDVIEGDEYASAKDSLSRLQNMKDFSGLVTVLEQELRHERELYETQPASEHQRGQVVMLKKVISLLTNGN